MENEGLKKSVDSSDYQMSESGDFAVIDEAASKEWEHTLQDKATPATKQIDHDLPQVFPGHPWLDTPEGHAAGRRVLVGYSFRDSDVDYCQAGAKRVYVVEASEMADYAQKLSVGNPILGQRITVIKGKVEDVESPEKADISILEPMGFLLGTRQALLETKDGGNENKGLKLIDGPVSSGVTYLRSVDLFFSDQN